MNTRSLLFPVAVVPETNKFIKEISRELIPVDENLNSRTRVVESKRNSIRVRLGITSTPCLQSAQNTEVSGTNSSSGGSQQLWSPAIRFVKRNQSNRLSRSEDRDELHWDVCSLCTSESKLFFFTGVLWRMSFGINKEDTSYFYFTIAPAEKLSCSYSISCSFKIHSIDGHILARDATPCIFEKGDPQTCGFTRFMSQENASYYVDHKCNKFHLSVDIAAFVM